MLYQHVFTIITLAEVNALDVLFFLILVGSLFYRNCTLLLFNIGEGRGRYSVASFLNETIPDHYFFKE